MGKPKTICIMTSVHRFDDVRIYQKQAKSLKSAGFDVTILCANLKDNLDSYEDENGIRFIKLDMPQKRLKRILKATSIFYKKAKELDCDFYHFHDPELLRTGLKLRKRAKVIYDVHEDVPRQILTKPYLKPFVAKLASFFFERYEKYSAKRLYAVVAAEPVISKRLETYNSNTILVHNYPIIAEFIKTQFENENRQNSVCYVGGITKIRGIFEMLEAVEKTDINLILAGDFESDELKQDAMQKKGYKNVDYRGFVGRKEISEILSAVCAGLVTLHPIPKYLTALPVKMFEYMAACVPVISSNFPYWQGIVNDAKCGICVDPLKPEEIKQAIEYIISHPEEAKKMGENGRVAVMQKYNWDIEKQKLISFYLNDRKGV